MLAPDGLKHDVVEESLGDLVLQPALAIGASGIVLIRAHGAYCNIGASRIALGVGVGERSALSTKALWTRFSLPRTGCPIRTLSAPGAGAGGTGMSTRRRGLSAAAATIGVVLLTILAVGGGATRAQEGSGTPTAAYAHPAHIHGGTCDALGEVIYPLNDLVPTDPSATPAADGEIDSMSTTTIQLPDRPHEDFDHFISGGYALNVHASAEDIGTYIACGDIGGQVVGNQIQIELRELNGSGFQGHATLTDNDDGTMTVTVVLTRTGAVGTPIASPTT